MKNNSINLDSLTKKAATNQLEVEDLISLAVSGDKSHADFIDILCAKYKWLDAESAQRESKVPLAAWAKVVVVYLREGYDGLAALVDTKSSGSVDNARFVISVLKELHTRESVELLIKVFNDLLNNPDLNNVLTGKLVTAFNLLLSFPPMLDIDKGSEKIIRSFLHKSIELNPSESELASIYCALRGVGDESSIDLIKKGIQLKSHWKGTEQLVTTKIRERIRKNQK